MRIGIYTAILFLRAQAARIYPELKPTMTGDQLGSKFVTISTILNDGQSGFDPWDKIRWAEV